MTSPVTRLCHVDHSPLARWVSAIPHRLWPDQDRLCADSKHPALINDLEWQGFGAQCAPFVANLIEEYWPGYQAVNHKLCILVPGQRIPEHTDPLAPEFVARVHVPLTSNPKCWMRYGQEMWHLAPGWAWTVDYAKPHSIGNDGDVDRVHFFFDVMAR